MSRAQKLLKWRPPFKTYHRKLVMGKKGVSFWNPYGKETNSSLQCEHRTNKIEPQLPRIFMEGLSFMNTLKVLPQTRIWYFVRWQWHQLFISNLFQISHVRLYNIYLSTTLHKWSTRGHWEGDYVNLSVNSSSITLQKPGQGKLFPLFPGSNQP